MRCHCACSPSKTRATDETRAAGHAFEASVYPRGRELEVYDRGRGNSMRQSSEPDGRLSRRRFLVRAATAGGAAVTLAALGAPIASAAPQQAPASAQGAPTELTLGLVSEWD